MSKTYWKLSNRPYIPPSLQSKILYIRPSQAFPVTVCKRSALILFASKKKMAQISYKCIFLQLRPSVSTLSKHPVSNWNAFNWIETWKKINTTICWEDKNKWNRCQAQGQREQINHLKLKFRSRFRFAARMRRRATVPLF